MTTTDDQTDALTIVVEPLAFASASTRRRERRVEGCYRVRYRAEDEEWTTRLCLNLSKGGLFVATHTRPEAGTLLYVELYDGDQWLRARVRVQWTRSADLSAPAPEGMGLQVLTHHFADVQAWTALLEREGALLKGDTGAGLIRDRPVMPIAPSWMEPPVESAVTAGQHEPSRAREAVMLVGHPGADVDLLTPDLAPAL